MSFDPDLTACAQLVERGDPDRFAATMAAPADLRRVLFPIYAFNVEVSRAPWVTQETLIAEMRLQWWADALSEIEAGGLVRRQEVVTSLAHVLNQESARLLQKVVSARRWDAQREPFEDADALDAYLEDTSSTLLNAAALAISGSPSDALCDLGYASGLAQYLRAVPELERHGRRPLVDGRPEAVAALARKGLDRLERARCNRTAVPLKLRPVALAGWQAAPLLKQAAANPQNVADGTLAVSDARKKLRLVWQAASGRW